MNSRNHLNENHDNTVQAIPTVIRSSEFKELQNQFRGIVASVRSSGFQEVKDSTTLAINYSSSLKALFLNARTALTTNQFKPFISWISSQESAVLSDIQSLPKGYEQLSGVADSKPASLTTEIRWVTAVLERHIDSINQFREVSDEVCRLVLRDEFSLAIERLDSIDQSWGISLWSLQLRVALTNEAYGLEAQKKVVADARAAFKRGLLGFAAYYFGVRNESRTTAERFTSTTGSRIAEHRYFSNEVKTFLRHHLLGQFPNNHSGMADLLRISQSHHFFDLYEDLISVLQSLCFKPKSSELALAISGALQMFASIKDFRLDKLKHGQVEEQLEHDQPAESPILNALMSSTPQRALMEFARKSIRSSNPNPWEYIYLGWALSEGRLKPQKEKRIVRRCVRFIAATFTSADFFDPHDAITKLARNFGQLPFFRALRIYSDQVNSSTYSSEFDHRSIGLNSPVFGLEDLNRASLHSLSNSPSSAGKTERSAIDFWAAFSGQKDNESDDLALVDLAKSVGKALRREDSSAASSNALEVGRNTLGAKNFFRDFVMLQRAIERYQRGEVLSIIATACSSAVYSPLRHKILEATKGYTWEDYQQCTDAILRSVAVRMVWEQNRDAKVLSTLRFSVKRALAGSADGIPSKLDWEEISTPRTAVVFFLNRVCTMDVLDILKGLRGSRQVLDERASICTLLKLLDPENAYYYSNELAELREELLFADGQLIVDSSRIYVETPQLRQWAKANLSEDYSRFRDLSALGKEKSQPFDELLAEIRRGQRDTSAPFLAETEADVLLYSILLRLRDEFLTNATFGLDFFLSKRIRHQSFIGSIRAPLELEELITNRSDEESSYKPNHRWVNRLAVSGPEPRQSLLAAFDAFSEAFDQLLLDAKNNSFQLLGKEKPKGLIFLPLSSNIIELSKSLAPIDSSFEGFLDTAVALLWIGVEPALGLTRSFIRGDLKERLTGEINSLRAKVREAVGNTTEFLEFDANIGKRSSEVQVKLDECAGWFTRTNLDFTGKTFSLNEAIEMAQVFALSCLRGFDPEIEPPLIASETEILAPSLVHIHDQVLIALQNAKDHSGLKNPRIRTEAQVDGASGVLRIRVESEVKPSVLEKAREGAAERKRLIAEGKSRLQTRKEGGSGFFKLSAMVDQSSKGKLDFGLTAEGMFFLEVQYSLIIEDG